MSLLQGLRRTSEVLFLLAATVPLAAQFNLGKITGTVFDPNGAIVVGCKVTVVSLTNLSSRAVLTNSFGLYTVPSLPVDTYEVTVEVPGFQRAGIRLAVGVDQTVSSDFQLQLGNAFKRFPFGEKRWVQFRTDFFGTFNHPQFSVGATQAITASTFGQVTSAAGSRLIQMSLQVAF